MKRGGIKARTDREQALKYSCNEDFFEVVDTERKAYWLGFIYADGYITTKRKHSCRRVGVSISKRDVELLERLKEDIEATHPINEYEVTSGFENSQNYVRLLISSEKMASDLEQLGAYEQKTEILTFPTTSQVPSELQRHFIRGYMDGDGSIFETKKTRSFAVSFCGTMELIQGVQDYFGTNLTLDKRHDNDVNNYSISIGGNRQAERVLETLYKDATVFLRRKHDVYLRLVQRNQEMDEQLHQEYLEYESEKDFIVREYAITKNIKHLAKRLSISTTKIRDILRERNVHIYRN